MDVLISYCLFSVLVTSIGILIDWLEYREILIVDLIQNIILGFTPIINVFMFMKYFTEGIVVGFCYIEDALIDRSNSKILRKAFDIPIVKTKGSE